MVVSGRFHVPAAFRNWKKPRYELDMLLVGVDGFRDSLDSVG
jgi:hypothetical protein